MADFSKDAAARPAHIVVRQCIFVRSRVRAVWELVSDLNHWPLWASQLREIREGKAHLVRGPVLACQVVGEKRERLMAVEFSRFGRRVRFEARLLEITEGTVVTIELTSDSVVVARLLGGLLVSNIERSLQKLKALVEQKAARTESESESDRLSLG